MNTQKVNFKINLIDFLYTVVIVMGFSLIHELLLIDANLLRILFLLFIMVFLIADWAYYYSEISVKYYEPDRRYIANIVGVFAILFSMEGVFFNKFVLFYLFFMVSILFNIVIWEYYSVKKYDRSIASFYQLFCEVRKSLSQLSNLKIQLKKIEELKSITNNNEIKEKSLNEELIKYSKWRYKWWLFLDILLFVGYAIIGCIASVTHSFFSYSLLFAMISWWLFCFFLVDYILFRKLT